MTVAITRIRTAYVAVDDVTAAVAFYQALLGPPRFRDGDRWAQFDAGGTGFAVASRAEAARDATGTVIVFESDADEDHQDLIAAGAKPLEARDMGSHGHTRTYQAPDGHLFQLFRRAS